MRKSNAKKGKKTKPSKPLKTLMGFAKLLEQMEKKGEKERTGSGRTSVFGLATDYWYNIKLGVEPKDFRGRYR